MLFTISIIVIDTRLTAGSRVVGAAADAGKAAPGMLVIGVLATNRVYQLDEYGLPDLDAMEKVLERANGIAGC